jgi:beta-glucuronidase
MFRRCLLLLPLVLLCAGSSRADEWTLSNPGEEVIDYSQYGTFQGEGTESYRYVISDHAGLKAVIGEGIYPDVSSVFKDPEYRRLKAEGRLNGSQWDYVNNDAPKINFYKWATTQEEPGVRLYYTAMALERAGLIEHAIKAYYAIVVHFPKATGMTYWKSPWYIGPVAIDKIKYLTRENPQLGLKIVGASIKVKNRFDDEKKNDSFIVTPGKLVKVKPSQVIDKPINLAKLTIEKTIGTGRFKLVRYSNRHWQFLVDDKPYVIRGIAYSPTKIGLSQVTSAVLPSRVNAMIERLARREGGSTEIKKVPSDPASQWSRPPACSARERS